MRRAARSAASTLRELRESRRRRSALKAKAGGFMGFHAACMSEAEQRMFDSLGEALAPAASAGAAVLAAPRDAPRSRRSLPAGRHAQALGLGFGQEAAPAAVLRRWDSRPGVRWWGRIVRAGSGARETRDRSAADPPSTLAADQRRPDPAGPARGRDAADHLA